MADKHETRRALGLLAERLVRTSPKDITRELADEIVITLRAGESELLDAITVNEMLRRERDGEVWVWQGDADDHPESLACPVLMSADDVRGFVRMRAALTRAVAIALEAFEAWDSDRDSRVGKLLLALAGHRRGYRADIDAIHEAANR